jgi:hypothetical protein
LTAVTPTSPTRYGPHFVLLLVLFCVLFFPFPSLYTCPPPRSLSHISDKGEEITEDSVGIDRSLLDQFGFHPVHYAVVRGDIQQFCKVFSSCDRLLLCFTLAVVIYVSVSSNNMRFGLPPLVWLPPIPKLCNATLNELKAASSRNRCSEWGCRSAAPVLVHNW